MTIKKIINLITVSILVFVLAFKFNLLNSPAFQPIEIGELQINSKYSKQCAIDNQEINLLINQKKDNDFKNIKKIVEAKPNVCGTYWGKNIMRGFYLHHYQSIFKELDIKNGLIKNLSKGINHQYGFISIIIPWLIILSKIKIDIQLFASFSFLIGIILNFLLVYFGRKKKILSSEEFSVITILISFAIINTNLDQYLLSPGFSPIRVLPINVFSLFLIALTRNKIKINSYTTPILFINFLILSPQFELLLFFGLVISNFLSFILLKIEVKTNRLFLKKQLFINQKILLILFVSILIKIISLLIIGEPNLLFYSSIGESTLHKKVLLTFFVFYSGLWIINGINNMTTNDNFNDIENKLNLSSPLFIYPSLLFSYSAKFWGSPNHFSLYLLAVSIAFGILATNIIHMRLSNNYEINQRFSLPRNFSNKILRTFNHIFFKLTLIKKNYDLPKNNPLIYRLLFILISYLLLFQGTLYLMVFGRRIYRSEIIKNNLYKQTAKLDFQIDKEKCKSKKIEIKPLLINSCSLFNTNFYSHKLILSKSFGNNNNFLYLSDNDVLIEKSNRKKIILGGSLTPLSGKLEIINNPIIKNAFDKSFEKFEAIKHMKSDINSPKKFEKSFDILLNLLINDLFIYEDFEKEYISKNVLIDSDLQFRTKQLYLYSFALWSDPNFSYEYIDFLEVASKLYKYLWRYHLIQNRTKEGFTLLDNIKIGDIVKR